MRKWGIFWGGIMAIGGLYLLLALSLIGLYEPYDYDCSNMVADQKLVFDRLSIESDIAVNFEEKHTWLILEVYGHDIHWEATAMMVRLPMEYDERWDSLQVLRKSNISAYEEFRPRFMKE